MTSEQRARLTELLPAMRANASNQVTQNGFHKATNDCVGLQHFLNGHDSQTTAEEWIAIAEKATERN